MADESEDIVVIESKDLFDGSELGYFEGVNREEFILDKVLGRFDKKRTIKLRSSVEEDSGFKQPISYVIIRKKDRIYVSERLKAGGEERLHNSLSLGFGGHMNDTGDTFEDILISNTLKELDEELYLDLEDKLTLDFIGVVNDDSKEVSKCHIGFGYVLYLGENDKVSVRETHKLRGFWLDIEEFKDSKYFERLESWGRLFLSEIVRG